MAAHPYAEFLPPVIDWIQQTLAVHAVEKRSVTSFNFLRLPRYFSGDVLNSAYIVITNHLPRPPLAALGLPEFSAFERQPMGGITFMDTYFLEPDAAPDESVHFHEMVHVIQWRTIGPENFLLLYAAGLLERGYMDSPLEMMAYNHQHRFDSREPPYSVESEVRTATLGLARSALLA